MAETNSKSQGQRGRAVLYLVLIAAAAAMLLAGVEELTHQRIENNVVAEKLAALRAVLPADEYDNKPHFDFARFLDPELLGSDEPALIYRARKNGEPVAAVLTAVTPNGFSGQIRLLVSVRTNGEVLGVRVIDHRETPGLGDNIEIRKSDWIELFTGLQSSRLLADPFASAWTLDSDGGSIDHITSATITSRAVVKAVRNAVLYFNTRRDEIFAAPRESLEN
jgi:electron transport complex protein RnfG